MQMKKLTCDALPTRDILSLLEITRDYCGVAATWQSLRPMLERHEAWGIYQEANLIAYGLFTASERRLSGSVTLVCFRYRWEFNDEVSLMQMMRLISAQFIPRFRCLLMDVNRIHELNLGFYHKIGFCDSILPSQKGKEYLVLLAELHKFPATKGEKDDFNA